MKKLFTALFFLLVIAQDTWAQTWARMQSWGLDLESIVWISATEGVSVGENLIIRTSDGGLTWDEVLQEFDTRFLDVAFLEDGNGVAVGEKGSIFTSSDFGETWQQRNSGTQNNLNSVAKTSSTQLVAVGQNGEILQSFNAGSTWSKVSSGTNVDLHDITFVNENTAFVAAANGRILKSFDKGSTWTSSVIAGSRGLFGVVFSSEMIGYVVGENGTYLKTIDGGETWAELPLTTNRTLRKVSISPVDIRIVVAVGDTATVVRTANSGTTFTYPNLGATNTRPLKNLAFKPNLAQASAVGQDGYLLNSTNSGASWAQKFAGIRNNFTTADFKNLNTGFIAGENGGFFVTSNGAASLISRPLPEPLFVQTIDFWNTGFGYSSSPAGKIYRTGNSGSAWVQVFLPVDRTLSGFYLFAPSVLYAAGNNGYITRSFDSGGTWDQTVVSNTTENLKDITFFDFGFGFAIGDNGQISWSFGGNEWENSPKVTTEDLNALAKLDTTRAIIVGNGGTIFKTEDKARTWRKIESGTTKNLNSIDFFGENIGFIAGDKGLALVTLDAGETWTATFTGTLRDLSAVSAGTDSKAYFVGEDGSILTYNCIPPVGSLGEISGNSQSCISNEIYTIAEIAVPGSEIIWRVDGGEIISGQGTNQIEVKWTIPGRNAVLVSSSNFCGTGETSALEVAVNSIPQNNLLVTGEGISCVDNSNTYSLPKIEGTTYSWTVTGGEIISGQGTHEVEINWNQAGDQLILVAQENRCGTADPIQKVIRITTAPDQPSVILGENQTALGEHYYEIEGTADLDYKWSISDGGRVISGQGTSRILVIWEQEGDFQLSVEAQNECGFGPKRNLAVNVNLITALEPNGNYNLKIYPNPSFGSLTISSGNLDSWSSLLVFNPMGQLVQSQDIGEGQSELYLSGLPRGLLLIQLQGKNGSVTEKILVQ